MTSSRRASLNSTVPLLTRENCTNETINAFEAERTLGVWDALRLYPTSVGWSILFSIGVIMLGFDPQLLGNLYAMPAFRTDFGRRFGNDYIIPSAWQSALSIGNPTGQCLGALFGAWPMDYYGRKPTFLVCVILTAALISIDFFATNLHTLLVGELIIGLVLGAYVVLGPAYASEICPLALRGILTSWTNLCFVLGQLLANVITTLTHNLQWRWAYRLPFACQWIPCLIILSSVLFAPESPWWLVRQGRKDDAAHSLQRLGHEGADVAKALAAIVETDRLEHTDATYHDCFVEESGNSRRTEIAIGVYAMQVLSGIYLINFGTLFFSLAGLSTDQAFQMGIGFLLTGLIACLLNWVVMGFVGRRSIYLYGVSVMAVLQFFIGVLDCMHGQSTRRSVIWAQCACMLAWSFTYNLSLGPVCFVILCEVSATRVRAKTIAVATAVQGVLGMLATITIPYIINPDGANLRGKLGFFWAASATACWIWAYRKVPETSGKTFGELDWLFEHGVDVKHFSEHAEIVGDDCNRDS